LAPPVVVGVYQMSREVSGRSVRINFRTPHL
jgi:hypothetical protein